jgi:hypothetical protein
MVLHRPTELAAVIGKVRTVDEQMSGIGDFTKRCRNCVVSRPRAEVRCLEGGKSQTLRRGVDLTLGDRFEESLSWGASPRPARALGLWESRTSFVDEGREPGRISGGGALQS